MVHILIPDIKAYPGNRKVEWLNKLVGKKIGETTDATTFAEKDISEPYRIFSPSYRMLMDERPDRLNVFLDEESFVRYIDFY